MEPRNRPIGRKLPTTKRTNPTTYATPRVLPVNGNSVVIGSRTVGFEIAFQILFPIAIDTSTNVEERRRTNAWCAFVRSCSVRALAGGTYSTRESASEVSDSGYTMVVGAIRCL